MNMDNKISLDKKLNEIVFELGKRQPVRNVPEVNVPGIRKEFLLSAPYRIGEKGVVLARYGFGSRDIFYQWPAMTPETAADLTKKYLQFQEIVTNNKKNFIIELLDINPALYETPQPVVDGGNPLNAFEVKGRVYYF